jgi:serine/threonine protein kinase
LLLIGALNCTLPLPSPCAFASLAFPANTRRRRRWCLGILLYEMHVGKTPFVHKDRKQMYHSIIKKDPEYPASFPPLAKDLCNKLLWSAFRFPPGACRTHAVCSDVTRHFSKTYQSRLGSGSGGGRDVQAHPYFRGLDWQMLLRRDVAMDKDWIPLIDERDGVQVVYLFIYLFICLFIYLFIYLFVVCLFVCVEWHGRRTQAISCDFRHTALCF